MRTKIGKRIGPLPIAVAAVFALAALLSLGLLLAPNATPTAEAQDANCMVKNTGDAATGQDEPDLDTTMAACVTTGSSAKVSLEGAIGREDADALTVYLYAKNGTISNGTTTTNVWDYAAVEPSGGAAAVASTRFSTRTLTIPKGIPAQAGGVSAKRSKVDIMVTPSTSQSMVTLYVFYADDPPEQQDFDHDGDSATDDIKHQVDEPNAIADGLFGTGATSGTMTITFLGAPALGKDSTNDINKKVDDEMQCVDADPDTDPAIDTAERTRGADGSLEDCPAGTEADSEDTAESRSKLVVRKGAITDINPGTEGHVKMLLDAKELEYTVTDNDAVTIYAVIEDENGVARPGTDVTFDVSSIPDRLGPQDRTVDALEAIAGGGTPTNTQVVVDGAVAADAATNPLGITVGDAVAARLIGDLSGTAYRVSVKVMAGDLNLGTVNIARAGKPTMLDAGIYNKMCIGGDDMDMFKMSMKDCAMVMGAKARFPREAMFAVNATVKDASGTKITMGENSEWMIKDLAASNVVSGKMDTATKAYILTVKDDAPLGRHTLTLTHASDDVADVTLNFYVAGPPKSYKVTSNADGPNDEGKVYVMGRRITFTVTAVDENDGVPHFITMDDPDTDANEVPNHTVQIDAIDGDVGGTNVDRDDVLTLDTDNGMGTFRYTIPRGPESGDEYDIFIGEGDMQETVVVVFGEAPPEMTVPGKPMDVEATADGHDTIDVSWEAPDMDGHSPITGYIIERRYDGDMMNDIPSDGYNTAAGGASFAFSDHMEWWETLNCKGMLAAAGSTADHTMDSDDKTMYCAHYDMTEPTNMAGTITTGGTTDMAIKALFDKRYVITGDTTTMHSDTGLMAATEYTYRVSAVNAIGRSMWSDADTATTGAAPLAETKAPTGAATSVLRNSITVTWDTNSATSTDVIKVALFDDGVTKLVDIEAFRSAADPGIHTFTNVPSGTYKVYLAAVDSEGKHVLADPVTATVN